MKRLAEILAQTKNIARPKNISREFQIYGVYLAEQLDDTKHYALYIKLAKQMDRNMLEDALSFAKGYYTAKSRAKIFMWRLQQLKKLQKELQI